MLPKISVIVPVYNAEKELPFLFASLKEQSLAPTDFEVIFADNGSSDASLMMLKSFVEGWCGSSRIVCEHENPGSYAARNKALDTASGRFVAFTDSDCRPDRLWLEKIVEFLESQPLTVIGGGEVVLFAQDSKKTRAVEKFEIIFGFPQAQNIQHRGYSVTANLFAHRALFDQVGYFDARFRSKGDYEWCQRALNSGCDLHFVKKARVFHPARRSLRQLVTKTRRVAGGQQLLKEIDGVVSKGQRVGIVHQIGVVVNNTEFVSRRDKFEVLAISAVVFLAKTLERIRLWFGASAERR